MKKSLKVLDTISGRKNRTIITTILIIIVTLLFGLQFLPLLVDQYKIWKANPQDNGLIEKAESPYIPFVCPYREPKERSIIFIGDSVTYGVKSPKRKHFLISSGMQWVCLGITGAFRVTTVWMS